MGEFLVFTVKGALILTFLFAIYKLTIGNSTRFGLRRLVLISIYVLSVLIPIMGVFAFQGAGNPDSVLENMPVGNMGGTIIAISHIEDGVLEPSPVYGHAVNVIAIVMIFGISVCLMNTVLGFLRIAKYRFKSHREFIGELPVAVISESNQTPFTFGGTVFLSEKEYNDRNPMVLAHEYCHSHSLHYLDLILARVVGSLMWWNPFVWLMLRELHDVHEFQADDYVMARGYGIKDYQMLLIRKAAGTRLQTFADSLNHSKLKTRLTMMKKSEKRGSMLSAVLMIPAMAAGAFLLSTDTVASMLEPMRNVDVTAMIPMEVESPESDGKVSEKSAQPQEIVIAGQNQDAEGSDNSIVEEVSTAIEAESFIDALSGDKKEKDNKKEGKGKDKDVDKNPAIRIDGKLMPENYDMNSIDPSEIESISVFKDDPKKYPNGLIDITLKKGGVDEKHNESAANEPLKVIGYGSQKKSDMQGEEIPNVYITTSINNTDGTNVTLIIVPGNGKEIKIDEAQLVVNGKTYDADSLSSSFSKSDDMAEQKIEIKLNKTLHKFDSKKDRIILQTSNGTLKIPMYNLK